ncbi:MAG: ferritin-like domain-containing protein [Clostridia bacterium]|nr:ferritin-like domain-containing protein [Deltaproteobacteria bacterium]
MRCRRLRGLAADQRLFGRTMSLRGIISWLTSLVVWRSAAHTARKLYGFALAEQGSAIDLSMAAQLCTDAERAATYLQHAMDESRHAVMFSRRAGEFQVARGMPSYGAPRADVDHLFESLGELRFVAFVHRGERRARTQFNVYQRYFETHDDAKTAAIFARVLDDEREHERYTWKLLIRLSGSEAAARRELRRSVRWEATRTWLRYGRAFSRRVFTVGMWLLYIVVAPLALLVRVRTRSPTGWHP